MFILFILIIVICEGAGVCDLAPAGETRGAERLRLPGPEPDQATVASRSRTRSSHCGFPVQNQIKPQWICGNLDFATLAPKQDLGHGDARC